MYKRFQFPRSPDRSRLQHNDSYDSRHVIEPGKQSKQTMPMLRRHILSVAFPALGHIIPQMELMKRMVLEDRSLLVTFVVSAAKMEDTRKRDLIPEELKDDIRLFSLHDNIPVDIDVDPGVDHKMDVKNGMEKALKQLFDTIPPADRRDIIGVQKPTHQLLTDSCLEPVHAVITDIFVGLPAKLCRGRGLPCYLLSTSCGFTVPMLLTLTEDVPVAPDETYYLPAPPGKRLLQRTTKEFFLFAKEMILLSTGILVNSFRELEPNAVGMIAENLVFQNIPVWFTGPLLHQEKGNETTERVHEWLDAQEERSIVCVSFGSMVFPTVAQLKELASGLRSLGRPFIWSLRTDQQHTLSEEFQHHIAQQMTSIEKQQFLILPWIPQTAVLSHPACGVFVSHCGWNGTLEAVMAGVPIVCWPLYGDQPLNAKFIVELELGVMVPQTALRSEVICMAEEVRKHIEKVGNWGEVGEERFGRNAKKIKEAARKMWDKGGSSRKDFDAFRKHLLARCGSCV